MIRAVDRGCAKGGNDACSQSSAARRRSVVDISVMAELRHIPRFTLHRQVNRWPTDMTMNGGDRMLWCALVIVGPYFLNKLIYIYFPGYPAFVATTVLPNVSSGLCSDLGPGLNLVR
jgi:hypothetical protein